MSRRDSTARRTCARCGARSSAVGPALAPGLYTCIGACSSDPEDFTPENVRAFLLNYASTLSVADSILVRSLAQSLATHFGVE